MNKTNTQPQNQNSITYGCGGKKGTKCGVELYIMPHDSQISITKAVKK
jgi:hypothetical protein